MQNDNYVFFHYQALRRQIFLAPGLTGLPVLGLCSGLQPMPSLGLPAGSPSSVGETTVCPEPASLQATLAQTCLI